MAARKRRTPIRQHLDEATGRQIPRDLVLQQVPQARAGAHGRLRQAAVVHHQRPGRTDVERAAIAFELPVQETAAGGEPVADTVVRREIRGCLRRRPALTRYVEDGRIEIDNNPAERALRSVAMGRKDYLFAGSDAGGERAAVTYTLIETAKLSGVKPSAWRTDVIGRIADHPARRPKELLSWNWSAPVE